MENILFRNVGSNDVDRVIEIERECESLSYTFHTQLASPFRN